MSCDYEKLYAKQAEALGRQTPALAAFLAQIAPAPVDILDVGCGQGRDALPLARAGHRVTAVDLAPSGIAALRAAAARDGLAVTAQVADITDYEPQGAFDVVLVDRTLHMLASVPRAATLRRLMAATRARGWLVIVDETSNLPAYRTALDSDSRAWRIARCEKGQFFAQQTG